MNEPVASPVAQSERTFGDVLLAVDHVSLSFGEVRALIDVSFDIHQREILAIIGPNGAGKTTMLNVLNGVYSPDQGTITFKGEPHDRMRPHESAANGIARTFQNVALFKGMSTLDNIMTGRNLKMKGNLLYDVLFWGAGFTKPIKVTCEDHEGNGPVIFQQWDGQKWNMVSDWITPMRDIVRPMIVAAANAYAKENNITKRVCPQEG